VATGSLASVVDAPPSVAGSRQPSQRRTRVVVLETAAGLPVRPDLIEAECDVALRVPVNEPPERLCAVIADHQPRLLLVKCDLARVDEWVIATCAAYDVTVLVLALPAYGLLQSARPRWLGGLPWIRLRGGRPHPGSAAARRCLDFALILATAPLWVPLLLLIAVALALAANGPPLSVQYRVGRQGRLFRMITFRTTRIDAERTVRLGRLLRRLHLDELPQLWNVLRGDMSLVGPRPQPPLFRTDGAGLALRRQIRPGLTGIAQLTNGYCATVEDRARCDVLYVNCRSLRLDLTLLVLTAIELLRGFPRG
jgi:lipopolysaccharide/colanic/teichoic acid biosynthesis glycosyltransferase